MSENLIIDSVSLRSLKSLNVKLEASADILVIKISAILLLDSFIRSTSYFLPTDCINCTSSKDTSNNFSVINTSFKLYLSIL